MKKSALRKDTFREIKGSIGRFLSILLIIAVGVGAFTGVKATAPSMEYSADSYFNENNLYDFQLLSTIGFSDDDVKEIKKIDEIDRVMPAYSLDVVYSQNNLDKAIKVMSLPENNHDSVNTPEITEGRLPENNNECILLNNGIFDEKVKIGDTITVKEQPVENTNLKNNKYKVVGFANMPQYFSYSYGTSSIGDGIINGVVLVSEKNFNYSRYTEVYLTLKCHSNGISSFSDEYKTIVQEVSDKLSNLGLKQYQAFINVSQSEIDKADAQLKAGQEEANAGLSSAKNELDDAEYLIQWGQEQLDDGESQYASASQETKARLSAARSELDAGWNEYNSAKAEYDAAVQTYNESLAQFQEYKSAYSVAETAVIELEEQLNSGSTTGFVLSDTTWNALQSMLGLTDDEIISLKEALAQSDSETLSSLLSTARSVMSEIKTELDESEKTLNEIKAQLDSAKIQLDEAIATLNSSENEYAAAKAQAEAELSQAERELNNAAAQLLEAKEEYYYGLARYNEAVKSAEAELSSGQNRLLNAKKELNDVKEGKWYCLTRNETVLSYKDFGDDAERLDAIANVFPIFFLLVAALVCMTTMSRMVDEQRMQLGTLKALGYKQEEILSKYLIYSAIAGILGCIFGNVIFIAVLPRVIFYAYKALYQLPYFNVVIPWTMVIIALFVAMACIMIVTLVECLKELRSSAATLMRPKAPEPGKTIFLEKIPFIWNHFSFFSKLTARNLLRYKRRLIMTVIGIMGSMALIVAGFGLDNAISPIGDLQYGELSIHDAAIYLDQTKTNTEISSTVVALQKDERVKDAMLVRESEVKAVNADGTKVLDNTYLFIPQKTENLKDYQVLRDYKTKETLSLNDEGAIITQKMSEELKAGIGDEVIMKIGEKKYNVKVTGIAECYISNYFYMTPTYYQKLTKNDAAYNVIYMNGTEKMTDQSAFSQEWLNKNKTIVTIIFTKDIQKQTSDAMNSLKAVVFVMIVCAGLLAFIVLYNLTNINISERIREIATVKVLGFNQKETNSYVFRENIIMGILGIIVGCVAGYFLTKYITSTVEVSMITFYRHIKWTSYVYAAVLTMLFTILVNMAMSKKIKKISMVESLKAVE